MIGALPMNSYFPWSKILAFVNYLSDLIEDMRPLGYSGSRVSLLI